MAMRLCPSVICSAMAAAMIAVALTAVGYAETADKPAINLPTPMLRA